MRILRSNATIAASRDRLFAVIEDAKLADQINPTYLRMEVVKAPWLPKPGEQTTFRVSYRDSSFDFVTEIAEYRRGHFLLERQVEGPFASWEHAVNVEDEGDDAQLTEVLCYSVRLGILGRAFDWITLRRDLEHTLNVRRERLRQFFAG